MWPTKSEKDIEIKISDIITALQESSKLHASDYLEGLLDQMPESQRWALLKLVTGGLRVGVSARMARLALSKSYEIEVDEIEQIWNTFEGTNVFQICPKWSTFGRCRTNFDNLPWQ